MQPCPLPAVALAGMAEFPYMGLLPEKSPWVKKMNISTEAICRSCWAPKKPPLGSIIAPEELRTAQGTHTHVRSSTAQGRGSHSLVRGGRRGATPAFIIHSRFAGKEEQSILLSKIIHVLGSTWGLQCFLEHFQLNLSPHDTPEN